MLKTNRKALSVVCALLLCLLTAVNASAAQRYWVGNGSNKNWNSTTNWSSTSGGASGASVPGSTDSAYFNGSGTGQCSVNTTVSIRRWEIASGYTDSVKQNSYAITVSGGMVLSGGYFIGGSAMINSQGPFTLSGTDFTSTSGALQIGGDYNFSSGTFSHNNGTVQYVNTISISGSTTFYDLKFIPTTPSSTYTIGASTVLTCNHMFSHTGAYSLVLNTGTIDVKGDITANNSVTYGGGTATINISGTGTQTLNGNSVGSGQYGWLCNVTINKPSGTLYLKDVIAVKGNWTLTAGTIDATTYNSTVSFVGGGIYSVYGTQSLNNVTVFAYGGAAEQLNVNTGDRLTVLGNLTMAGTGPATINDTIDVHGNITEGCTYVNTGNNGGSGTINIIGTGTQTFTGASSGSMGKLCNISINKSSGTLILKNIINVVGNWRYLQGTIDASTYTSKVAFCNGNRAITGKHTLYDVEFTTTTISTNTFGSSDTLTVDNKLECTGGFGLTLSGGAMKLKGDVTITNTATTGTGNTVWHICGTGNQTLTGTTAGQGRVPAVKIDKASGTLTLKNATTVMGSWYYVQGTVDASTYNSSVLFGPGTRTIQGSHSLYDVQVYAVGAASINNITSGDSLTVTGELKLAGTYNATVNTGVLNVKGDLAITNTSTGNAAGTGIFNICGTGSQTLTGSNISNGGQLSHVHVRKPSGTLYLALMTTVGAADWLYYSGNVDPGISSTVAFFGNGNVNCKNGSATMPFYNFSVISGTRTLTGLLRAQGAITITASRVLNGNGQRIQLGGNWNNSGSFTYANCLLILNGKGPQRIIKSSGTETFDSVYVNRGKGIIYLNSPVACSKFLGFNQGIIATDATNYISIPDNGTVTAGSDSSYICGPVRKTGNDAFTFPLGDTLLATGAYHPLGITAPANATDAFTGQYFSSASANTAQVDSIDLSTCEYWTIARTTGSSAVKATPGWNSNNCLTADAYDMIVAGWDGTASLWKSLESTAVVIDSVHGTGTVTASATPFWNGASAVPIMVAKKKAITVTEHVRDPYCFTGTTKGFVHLGVAYGAPPFSYAWADTSSAQDRDSLVAGTYSITITDRYGRHFNKRYVLQNCAQWETLPSGLSADTTGRLSKTSGDTTWAQAQSVLVIDSLETGRWIGFTVADTLSRFLLGFGPVAVDSAAEETNYFLFLDGKQLLVIETDNDGFYTKELIGDVAVNDELRVELSATEGILYYKNDVLVYNGTLLSDARLKLTANIYGSGKNIKKIRCSSNN